MPKLNTIADFWRQVNRTDGCWNWIGTKPSGRYGRFKIAGEKVAAHRFSWAIHRGPVPTGMHVLHRCDNPACVRPDHLFLGTHIDNMADKRSKGRVVPMPGERNGFSKLTVEQVATIRRDHAAGVTQVALAARFGVCQSHISRLVLRKAWTSQGANSQ